MICVEADASGVLYMINPQPADVSACTMVLASPAELAASPWNLTVSQGEQIGGLILLAWATAWVFRQIGTFFEWRNNDEQA